MYPDNIKVGALGARGGQKARLVGRTYTIITLYTMYTWSFLYIYIYIEVSPYARVAIGRSTIIMIIELKMNVPTSVLSVPLKDILELLIYVMYAIYIYS